MCVCRLDQCIVASLPPKYCNWTSFFTFIKTLKCFTGNTYMLPLGIGVGLGSLLVIALLFFYRRHQMQKKKQALGKRFTNLINFFLFYHRISSNFNLWTSGTRKDDLDEGFRILFQQEQWMFSITNVTHSMIWIKGFVFYSKNSSERFSITNVNRSIIFKSKESWLQEQI